MINSTDLYWIVILCVNSVALFVLSILLIKNKFKRLPNLLGALAFGVCGLLIINNYIYESGFLLKHPHLYHVLTPTEYLIPTIYYISIRTHAFSQPTLKKFDWLFLLPVLFQVIDFLPFYSLSAEEKRAIIVNATKHTEIIPKQDVGYLPAYVHFALKYILGGVLSTVLWVKFYRHLKETVPAKLTSVEKWNVFNMSIFSIGVLSPFLLFFFKNSNITYPYFFSTFFTVIIFGIIFNLSISPEILYEDIFQPVQKIESIPYEINFTSFKSNNVTEENVTEEIEEEHEQKKFQLEKELIEEYKSRIEFYLIHEKPFLKHGYSLSHLSKDLNIPKHHLSMTFNTAFNTRYNDVFNEYRVEYSKLLMQDKSNENLTLEAIALNSGFNSRITFIRAFTKFTGMSPSEFNKDFNE